MGVLAKEQLERWQTQLGEGAAPTVAAAAGRQPIHTLYGGAQLMRPGLGAKMGKLAMDSLAQFAPNGSSLADALCISGPEDYLNSLHDRVVQKLKAEPVEDYRIDFEDGYGPRGDGEEDGHAVSAAEALADDLEHGRTPPQVGLRIKPLSPSSGMRALRTLDRFVAAVSGAGARLARSRPLLVTLPKVTSVTEVKVLREALETLERAHDLEPRTLQMELMVEGRYALVGNEGALALPGWISESRGRVAAIHFGVYDFLSDHGVVLGAQRFDHPAAVAAKVWMKNALGASGVRLVDGATTELPVAPFRGRDGTAPSAAEARENQRVVREAWRLHGQHVRHSLELGIYQSWDLHPAQIPARLFVLFDFFRRQLPSVGERLQAFVEDAARARRSGTTFDDAATGQGLLNHLIRGMEAGAFSEEEAKEASGLGQAELATRSFEALID